MSEGLQPNFQLNANYARAIKKAAVDRFGKDEYLVELASWLTKHLRINYSEKQIDSALKGQRSYRDLLKSLCRFIDADPRSAIINPNSRSLVGSNASNSGEFTDPIGALQTSHDIEHIVNKISGKIRFGFEREEAPCSDNRFTQVDWIQDRFIDLDVLEVEYLPSQNPAIPNASELQNNGDTKNHDEYADEYDRLNIRPLHAHKTTSRKILQKYERAFIYGNPGSGKSTFLRWAALNCRDRDLFEKRFVPLFLEVRNFTLLGSGQTLMTYFESTLGQLGITSAELEAVSSHGRVFFILDGVDEISKTDYRRLERMIRSLLTNYGNCRFLISSRLGFDIRSLGLKKVIISPFNSKKHIPKFVHNWFSGLKDGKIKAEMMLEKFRSSGYQNIREIARRPVLLRLLCILFEQDSDFPTRRADVFQQGINALVQQSSQEPLNTNIAAHPELLPNDVTQILCRVAYLFFVDMEGDTLFHTQEVKNVIRSYFHETYNIPQAQIDDEHILNLIEQYNGLLVRWANTFCSFSHLTYQEYFVAHHLVYQSQQETVYKFFDNPRWKFITELVAELLPNGQAVSFLEGFKSNVDALVNTDEKIEDFLEELNRGASLAVHVSGNSHPFTPVLIRAWYLAYAVGEETSKINGSLPNRDTYSFPDMFYATSMVSNDILELHGIIYDLYHCIVREYSESGGLQKQINKLKRLFKSKDSRKVDTFKTWETQITYQVNSKDFDGDKELWWTDKHIRKGWKRRVISLMTTLGVPCADSLSNEQTKQLHKYYAATHLFSNCLDRAAVNDKKRKKLASAMLLIDQSPPGKDNYDDFFKDYS